MILDSRIGEGKTNTKSVSKKLAVPVLYSASQNKWNTWTFILYFTPQQVGEVAICLSNLQPSIELVYLFLFQFKNSIVQSSVCIEFIWAIARNFKLFIEFKFFVFHKIVFKDDIVDFFEVHKQLQLGEIIFFWFLLLLLQN